MLFDHLKFILFYPKIGADMYLTHWLLFFKPFRIIFQKLKLYKIGKGSEIRPYCTINGTDSISIGKNVIIQPGCILSSLPGEPNNGIVIEDDVLFSPNVSIYSATHTFIHRDKPIKKQPMIVDKVVIRTGAWLGINSVILPGVTVGKNSVIGANSVVTSDVPDYCVAGGVPAKIIKRVGEPSKENKNCIYWKNFNE